MVFGPWSAALLGLLALCSLPTCALAQQARLPRAALLEQAQNARANGDHRAALALATQAGELKMTAALRRFLVEEEAALGLWSAAYADARSCVAEAALEPPSANHDAVLTGCKTLAQELRQHIALIVLDVPPGAPAELVVTLNGSRVSDPLHGAEQPVASGRVLIEATLPGHLPLHTELEGRAAEVVHVPIALVPEPAPPPPVPRRAAPSPRGPAPEKPRTRRVHGISGPLVAGAGVAVGVLSLAARLVADRDYASLKERCERFGCPNGEAARAHVDRLDSIALVGGVTSAVLLAAGASLYFVLDKHDRLVGSKALRFGLRFVPGAIDVQGNF
jgi:hypothetical protein